MSANILSYMMQFTLLQNNQFRSVFGIKSTQYQYQFQKELRDINKNANEGMKEGVDDDGPEGGQEDESGDSIDESSSPRIAR